MMNVETRARLNHADYLGRGEREREKERKKGRSFRGYDRCTGRECSVCSKREETFIFSRLNAIVRELITEARSSHGAPLGRVALRRKFRSCTRFVHHGDTESQSVPVAKSIRPDSRDSRHVADGLPIHRIIFFFRQKRFVRLFLIHV